MMMMMIIDCPIIHLLKQYNKCRKNRMRIAHVIGGFSVQCSWRNPKICTGGQHFKLCVGKQAETTKAEKNIQQTTRLYTYYSSFAFQSGHQLDHLGSVQEKDTRVSYIRISISTAKADPQKSAKKDMDIWKYEVA